MAITRNGNQSIDYVRVLKATLASYKPLIRISAAYSDGTNLSKLEL